jgi:hypothetical protein
LPDCLLSNKKQLILSKSLWALESGWPDWTKFRPLGYCFLWAGFWKLQK